MNIYPSIEEIAAIKIQAGFRGYRVRKQLKELSKDKNSNGIRKPSIKDESATKIQAGVRGFLVRKKQKQENSAATKIQASFRGFKVRQDILKIKQN